MTILTAGPDGRIDPVRFAIRMRDKVQASGLAGTVPTWGPQFGITTGSADESARFFTMVQQQESGHRIAPVNPDGTLQRFGTTPVGERSFGPGQFNVGEYGLKTWADVNDPEKVADAYIDVAKSGKVQAYFGSVQRPSETLRHAGWYDKAVAQHMRSPAAYGEDQWLDPAPPRPEAPATAGPAVGAVAARPARAAQDAGPAAGFGTVGARRYTFDPIVSPMPRMAQPTIGSLAATGLAEGPYQINSYGQDAASIGELVRRRA